jgi:aminoglycoside phosphotransferase (APT) family kinase protein
MLIQNSVGRLLAGAAEVLEKEVAAQVGDTFARQQVRAISEILVNLAERVDWTDEVLSEERDELLRLLAALGAEAGAAAEGEPEAGRRGALDEVVVALADLPTERVEGAGGLLREQAVARARRLRSTMYRPLPESVDEGAAVEARLRRFLAARLGAEDVALRDLRRHIEGFSWETYSMTIEWEAEGATRTRGLIMHAVPAAGLVGPYDVDGQFDLLAALRKVDGVPVAEPLWVDPVGEVTGRPMYVVDRVPGGSPTPWTVGSFFDTEEEQLAVGRQFAALGAEIHRVRPEQVPDSVLGKGVADPVIGVVDRWENQYRENCLERVPAGEYLFGWLRRNIDLASGRVGLVHGDFRVGNFMVEDARLTTMLDWETAHFGDPVEDLACATSKLLRGGRMTHAGGLLPLGDFIAAYEEAAGWEVPLRAIQYWWVMTAGMSFAQWLTAARQFERGQTDDARYPALGYQLAYQVKEAFATMQAVADGTPPWP